MRLFKKRTYKSVGKGIGLSLERQKQKEKIVRTLEKEEAEREKERALNRKIQELKARRPSFVKSAFKFAKKGSSYYMKKQKESLAREKKRGGRKGKPLSIKDLI